MPRTPMPPRPAFIPVQGVMQLEMVFTSLGQTMENVYHVIQGDGATAPTLAQMNALAAAAEAAERGNLAPGRNNSVALDHIVVRDLTTQSGPAIARIPSPAITGGNTSQALPGNVTAAVKWNTALRGRSFRGRTYHIGLAINHFVGEQLLATVQAGLTTNYTNWLAAINAVAGCTMGVVSYAHNNAWRTAGLFTPITVPTIDASLDSQRRRLAGRGR